MTWQSLTSNPAIRAWKATWRASESTEARQRTGRVCQRHRTDLGVPEARGYWGSDLVRVEEVQAVGHGAPGLLVRFSRVVFPCPGLLEDLGVREPARVAARVRSRLVLGGVDET